MMLGKFNFFLLFLLSLLAFLKFFLPKKKSIVVFGNRHGYKDNPKYLCEYLLDNQLNLKCIWIYKEKSQVGHQPKPHQFYVYSIQGIYYQLFSATNILTNGFGDISRFSIIGARNIQLWHGTPLKHILLDSNSFQNPLKKFIFKKYLGLNSFVISPSEEISTLYSRAFSLPMNKVLPTGYPRADIILAGRKTTKYKSVLYAPTWRDESDLDNVIDVLLYPQFLATLKELGYSLSISLHPKDVIKLSPHLININCQILNGDINTQLANFDVLITDYSSICFDFALLNRPILFHCPDLQQYRLSRGLYPHFDAIVSERLSHTPDELCKLLKKNFRTDTRFQAFNTYNTGNSIPQIANLLFSDNH